MRQQQGREEEALSSLEEARDLIDEATAQARLTLRDRAAQDPDGERKRVLDAFAQLNVMPATLDQVLGHPMAQASRNRTNPWWHFWR